MNIQIQNNVKYSLVHVGHLDNKWDISIRYSHYFTCVIFGWYYISRNNKLRFYSL